MAGLSKAENDELRRALQDAVVKCSERGLYQSAKWVAELLASVPSTTDWSPTTDATVEDSQMSDPDLVPPPSAPAVPIVLTGNEDAREGRLEADEVSRYLLAKSLFDCHEFDRCSAIFLPDEVPLAPLSTRPRTPSGPLRSPPPGKKGGGRRRGSESGQTSLSARRASSPPRVPHLSQKALFLALYAKFLAGEKRREEDSEMVLGPADGGATINHELMGLGHRLEAWFLDEEGHGEERSSGQGWLEFLYGTILAKSKNEKEAKKWLLRSVHRYPFHWGAWQELASLIGSVDDLRQMRPLLPNNLMAFIFQIHVNQELYQSTEQVYKQLAQLEQIFPNNPFLADFVEAEHIFSELVNQDPYRLESLDQYSNVLYVMNRRAKLAFIAQLAISTDRFRPESCCVAGNYYALKSEHEKAVVYFRRALTLDRSFLSAWTLMGHEYIELKNTHAAIESYRRAVDINRRDYRAWYGLGQTYEVMEMHYYALYYFQRAAALKPFDPKMWQAVGNCFVKLDRPREAIQALKRSLLTGTYHEQPASFASSSGSGADDAPLTGGLMDPELLYQIGLMYEKVQDRDEAAAYMDLTLAQEEASDPADSATAHGTGIGITPTTSRARMWLAKWEFARGALDRAMLLATQLCHDGVEVDESKALVRDLRARMEQAAT
ncbi:MAG: Anaphase-promoting complex subunit 23 [Phylliscum demangeonii]|nr:MAG: Anaphase-promoting complex subunit 23 [Phylliscum demangeonii]